MSKGNLKVLETIRIANGKFLQLVKAGEQYFVIAVGKDEVTKIAELTEDQLSILLFRKMIFQSTKYLLKIFL